MHLQLYKKRNCCLVLVFSFQCHALASNLLVDQDYAIHVYLCEVIGRVDVTSHPPPTSFFLELVHEWFHFLIRTSSPEKHCTGNQHDVAACNLQENMSNAVMIKIMIIVTIMIIIMIMMIMIMIIIK